MEETKEIQISEKVRVVVGFPDHHIEVKVSSGIPFVKDITLKLEHSAIPKVERAIAAAKAFKAQFEGKVQR